MDTPKTDTDATVADDPRAKQGSDIATSTAVATGTSEPVQAPGEKLTAQLAGDTPDAMIDALHRKHFAGTAITSDTKAWNQIHAFVSDIKRLWAELEDAVEKL